MANSTNLDYLIAQLHETSAQTADNQFQAAIALGETIDETEKARVVEALIEALNPEHQALTRAHAAQSLAQLQDKRAVGPLIEALRDDYQLVRAYAAGALAELDDPTAIPQLIDVFKNDVFYGARAAAASALGRLSRLCPEDDSRAREANAILKIYWDEERKKKEQSNERVMRELYRVLDRDSEDAVDVAERLKQSLRQIQDELGRSEQEIKVLRSQLDRAKRKIREYEEFLGQRDDAGPV